MDNFAPALQFCAQYNRDILVSYTLNPFFFLFLNLISSKANSFFYNFLFFIPIVFFFIFILFLSSFSFCFFSKFVSIPNAS